MLVTSVARRYSTHEVDVRVAILRAIRTEKDGILMPLRRINGVRAPMHRFYRRQLAPWSTKAPNLLFEHFENRVLGIGFLASATTGCLIMEDGSKAAYILCYFE